MGFLDQLCRQADRGLKTLTPGAQTAERAYPWHGEQLVSLKPTDQQHVAGLMRVNHTGEVCAQALYAGQALTAKSEQVRQAMQHAAREEIDHLAWCETRLARLSSRPSPLNPVFYVGSFAMGAIAGWWGDTWSLGFVEATERQVCEHLDSHLIRLPSADVESKSVLAQMRIDEQRHGDAAKAAGAVELPRPVQLAMTLMSKIMTASVYRI